MENEATEIANLKCAKTQKRTKSADRTESIWSWEICGPDLSIFSPFDKDLLELRDEYGEIRLRYAAHLIGPMITKVGALSRLALLRHALKHQWMSTYATEQIAAILLRSDKGRGLDRLPIPWLRTFHSERLKNALSPKQREYIEELAVIQLEKDHQDALTRLVTGEHWALTPMVKVAITPTPDYQFETVVSWLCFLVHGNEDPQLCSAHGQFRPLEKMTKAARRTYEDAWAELICFRPPSA